MTSGSGSAAATVAGAAPHNGENKPPQAIVKPQILTHVIEGFVIQEGAEPFPVTYPALPQPGLRAVGRLGDLGSPIVPCFVPRERAEPFPVASPAICGFMPWLGALHRSALPSVLSFGKALGPSQSRIPMSLPLLLDLGGWEWSTHPPS